MDPLFLEKKKTKQNKKTTNSSENATLWTGRLPNEARDYARNNKELPENRK